jgi:hypothetical protein
MTVAPGEGEPPLTPSLQSGEYETEPKQKIELKNQTEEQLIEGLLAHPEWTDEDRVRIAQAYELAKTIHAYQVYKGKPYIYHLLRVANRIAGQGYLEQPDADVVIAGILHDGIEDQFKEFLSDYPGEDEVIDPFVAQAEAFKTLEGGFGKRAAIFVKAVTNAPKDPNVTLTYEEKMEQYADKVESATNTFEGWLIKFSDWCENGLGIIHSELAPDSPQMAHFERKYFGKVFITFTNRFKEYQHLLSDEAQKYVTEQLTKGYQRLGLGLR